MLKTSLIDLASISLFVILIVAFLGIFTLLAENLVQDRTTEEITQALLTMSTSELNAFLMQIKLLLLFLILGSIVLLLVSTFIYAYSRTRVWHLVAKTQLWKKFRFKIVLQWLALIIITLIMILLFGLVFLVFRYILLLLVLLVIQNSYVILIIGNFLNLIFFLLALYLLFAVKYKFLSSAKVWQSVGEAFSLLKKKFSKLYKIFILQLVTLLLINLIIIIPLKYLLGPIVPMILELIIFLLFLSWVRIYFYQTVK